MRDEAHNPRGRARPVADAPVEALVARSEAVAREWLLTLLASAPLSAAAAIPVARLAADAPALCAAMARALGSDAALDELEADPLAARAGALAGAQDAAAAAAAVEALRSVLWTEARAELARPSADQTADLAARLALVAATVTTASLSAGESWRAADDTPSPAEEPAGAHVEAFAAPPDAHRHEAAPPAATDRPPTAPSPAATPPSAPWPAATPPAAGSPAATSPSARSPAATDAAAAPFASTRTAPPHADAPPPHDPPAAQPLAPPFVPGEAAAPPFAPGEAASPPSPTDPPAPPPAAHRLGAHRTAPAAGAARAVQEAVAGSTNGEFRARDLRPRILDGDPMQLLESAVDAHLADRRTLAVLLVELDGLDRLLAAQHDSEVAEAVERAEQSVETLLRPGDAARRDGDRRLWIALPGTGPAGARALALRVAAAVERVADHRGTPLTASVGVVVFPVDATDARGLADRAEDAVFMARATGSRGAAPPTGA